MSLETILSKTMGILIKGPRFMLQTRRVLAVTGYLFHRLKRTLAQANTKQTHLALLKILCSKLWARRALLTSVHLLATRLCSPKLTMSQMPTSVTQTATLRTASSTRKLQASSNTLSIIRDPTATSISNRVGGTWPLLSKMPHNQSWTTNLMVSPRPPPPPTGIFNQTLLTQ